MAGYKGKGLYNNTSGNRASNGRKDMFDNMRGQVNGARQAFMNAILDELPDDKAEKFQRTGKI